MADVPVQPRFDAVILVKKRRGVRDIELEVMARYSESGTEADGSRIRHTTRIGDVWNQGKDIVRGSGEYVAEVDPETMPGARRSKGSEIVFRLVLSTVTCSDCEFGNDLRAPR